MQLTANRRSVLQILLCIGTGVFLGVCTIIWLHTPPSKADQIRPLMKEIDDFKAKTGRYPTSCEQFAAFAKLTNQFSVYCVYSEPAPKGTIFLADRGVSSWVVIEHDFTVLLMPDRYKLFLSISGTERMHVFSSDSLSWQYDSKMRFWQKGRIYDSSFGSYWKPNFLP